MAGLQLARWGDGLDALSWPSGMCIWAFMTAFMFAWWRTAPAIWAGALIWSMVVVGTFGVFLVGGVLSERRESSLFWWVALPAATWFTYEQLRFLAVVARENRALPESHRRPLG
jgi:hypothetical protein